MNKMNSKQLRNSWINFYVARGHVNIGAVSLIGDGSTGVMFNVAGMQPLMPYLLGKKHEKGTRLCNIQGCVRTVDIESVGDESHFTFFEMMGNWSLGDYFKREKTKWSYEYLTGVLGVEADKICATVFAGDETAPRDEETAKYLIEAGIKPENIYYLGKEDNWWELEGTVGTPCGPDNEWFYPKHENKCSENCDLTCSCNRYVEIGNDVYMQYKKLENGKYEPLENKNVDTGFGFERLLMFINGFDDGYQTDLFAGAIKILENKSGATYLADPQKTRAMRIIADHIRTSVMLIGDKNGIVPSNVGAGYILRRLLRRAIREAKVLGVDTDCLISVAQEFILNVYKEAYPLLVEKRDYILGEIKKEADKFEATLASGIKEFEKAVGALERKNAFMKQKDANYVNDNTISGKTAFRLYDTFGFPLEMTVELAKEQGLNVDQNGFNDEFLVHQEKSKAIGKGMFKSGLSENSDITTKYHTATHLLNAALKLVLGNDCHQMGSNITEERLRFDFNCDHKLTEDEIKKIEDLVNGFIAADLPVTKQEMTKQKAVEIGAEHQFLDRYPDNVSVYFIGDVSKEICTGPHVNHTGLIGKFKITKEESSSSGVRRIKAIVE